MKTTIIATTALLLATPSYAGQERGQPTGAPVSAQATAHTGPATASVVSKPKVTTRQTVTVNQSAGGTGGGYSARGNTPDVVLPGVGGGHPCGLGGGAGGSGMSIGAVIGMMWPGRGCEVREKARLLFNLGDRAGAHEAACIDDDMRRAFYSAGHPCARDTKGWDR